MEQELKQILFIESQSSLSWYDWWYYWSPLIGIAFFICLCMFITLCFYSISSHDKTIQPMSQNMPDDQEMDQIVNTLLHQKRLTL